MKEHPQRAEPSESLWLYRIEQIVQENHPTPKTATHRYWEAHHHHHYHHGKAEWPDHASDCERSKCPREINDGDFQNHEPKSGCPQDTTQIRTCVPSRLRQISPGSGQKKEEWGAKMRDPACEEQAGATSGPRFPAET